MSPVAFAQDFQTKTIRHDGIEREYRLFVPDSIAPERSLVKDLNLNKLNCFLCGISNGGEMCYLTALQRPEDGENTLPSRLPLRKYLFLSNGIDPSLAAFVLKQHNEFELTVASSFMNTALLDQIVGIPAQHM